MTDVFPIDTISSRGQKAEALICKVLSAVYTQNKAPQGVVEYLKEPNKKGVVCAFFFSGRSGSFFAQSFFDSFNHPQVITVNSPALAGFDFYVSNLTVEQFNQGGVMSDAALLQWCESTLKNFPLIYTKMPDQPGFDTFCVAQQPFTDLVYAQLLMVPQDKLTHDQLLKIIFIAYRVAHGGPLDCKNVNVAFIWQAHTPSPERKLWIKKAFADHCIVTVARFPEKSLDSHLVHHGYETVSPPLHTLFRRLLLEHMAVNHEVAGDINENKEYTIRFEDLHHHTAFVLKALCDKLNVQYDEGLVANNFSLQVRGKKVSGARNLTRSEFEPKLLNYYDKMKIRYLMQEEYRQWGYDAFCEPSLDESLAHYENDEVIRDSVFGGHAVLCQVQPESPLIISQENELIKKLYTDERARRGNGVALTPLLYSLDDLPKNN